jgi:uncharacterized protein (DUF2249 family)
MRRNVVTLDVREDLRRGREPFSKIMRAVADLKKNQDLRLITPFEPKPLFAVLEQQGFSHVSRAMDSGDWEILFQSGTVVPKVELTQKENAPLKDSQKLQPEADPKEIVEVDARGLEPPEPMVRILEALAQLPEDGRLRARTDRKPLHLLEQIRERGFVAESKSDDDGSFITNIRRA